MSTKTVWGVGDIEQSEAWSGAHDTREEAIQDGIEQFEGAPFWICAGGLYDPADLMPSASFIVEQMVEATCDTGCPDGVDDPVHVKDGGEEALDELLKLWAEKYCECKFWTPVGKAERYEPIDPKVRRERLEWMAVWCATNNCQLQLEGSVGFMRECVGILNHGNYPVYGEDVTFTPENAYHKHDCVAVLGRGPDVEKELYDWLKWFEEHGYTVTAGVSETMASMHPVQIMMGQHHEVRMTKRQASP